MEPDGQNGPDASSLKPVSSLRAQFENMNKSREPSSTPPPVRNPSPSPKPPPVPDTRPPRNPSIAQDDGKPKLQLPNAGEHGASRSSQILNPPPLSPKPIRPPAVLVEPPQSPPKGRMFPAPAGDAGAHLNPDPTKSPSKTPTTPVASSSLAFKIPSRPNTPILEPGRSPRLNVSQPPSPPPPRRSAELRRDRDTRPAPGIPPPINRAEKPGNRLSSLMDNAPKLGSIPQRSPFNSPPSSASSPETEDPPVLPSRPARPVPPRTPSVIRTNTLPATLDPPPVHHGLANSRRDADVNGQVNAAVASQSTTAAPPALPVRPQTVTDPAHPKIPATSTMKPPPRPPRMTNTNQSATAEVSSSTSQPKRVVSTPSSQLAPPPTRPHGRSMTVSQPSTRPPLEFSEPPRRDVGHERYDSPSETITTSSVAPLEISTAYPDSSRVNRRPPLIKHGAHQIYAKDARYFDICGSCLACTSGPFIRLWNLQDGEEIRYLTMSEGVRATAVAFKPGEHLGVEGARLWVGNNIGELWEVDIKTESFVGNKSNAHGRYEVIKIFRNFKEMWTLDDGGTLHVWGPAPDGLPSLHHNTPHQTYRLPRGHTFSMMVGGELWHAAGKEIRVFAPTVSGRNQVQVLLRPLVAEGAGEVTAGTLLKSQPGKVFFGHVDGKVSIYSQQNFACLGIVNVSNYKINSLAGIGSYLWAAYNTGRICVYDVSTNPWVVKKDWQAHKEPIIKMIADPSSSYQLDRLQVMSLGADNHIRSWDGLLQDDFLESEMKAHEAQYCRFEDLKLLALTWNAGASTPSSLRHSGTDAAFIQNLLQSSDSPDILIFGFQELVDLEDKAATAKRLFKSKKKDAKTDQERMSHQYRDWRDFLIRSLDDHMSGELYHLLQTSTLVGLFTCIFVKSTIQHRTHSLCATEVKLGFRGLHGNKGAIIVRFRVDDTSLCFINCHLAAGQGNANARHQHIASIIDSQLLPVEPDPSKRMDQYVGGGDGSMILDHELCLLNGDLNYRIDTMSRDTVVYAVRQNNLAKLLDRDQLLVARRRNPQFKLRAFEEMPIQFAPTYKYDVGTDNYDSSEKQRSPAWCDRLLHRGSGRIQQYEYRRHEVRVSDHRPVTGKFKYTVKTISPRERDETWVACQRRFENLREKETKENKLNYLMNVIGYDENESMSLIKEQESGRLARSPSRYRE
ncbi:Endonuclease/exonuclease/phosphatase [Xylariaceae sp. FL0016]|nr:Endonuclease/exonuclease/phosphatase [Xylariaceae sp. FL0016]